MKILIGILAVIGLIVGAIALAGWLIMLVWGGLGLSFGFETISYGTACLVASALMLLGSFFGGRGK